MGPVMAPLDTDAVRRTIGDDEWDNLMDAGAQRYALCDEVDRLRAALAWIADGGCVCPVPCAESDPCDPMRARQALEGGDCG